MQDVVCCTASCIVIIVSLPCRARKRIKEMTQSLEDFQWSALCLRRPIPARERPTFQRLDGSVHNRTWAICTKPPQTKAAPRFLEKTQSINYCKRCMFISSSKKKARRKIVQRERFSPALVKFRGNLCWWCGFVFSQVANYWETMSNEL